MHEKLGFTSKVTAEGTLPVVVFSGELELSVADAAWSVLEGLIGPGCEGLTIDLGAVTFIDSRGLNVLIHALHALGGTDLILRNASERIVHLLNVSGVADRVRLV